MHLTAEDDIFLSEGTKRHALVSQVGLERLLDIADLISEMQGRSLGEDILMPALTKRAFPLIKKALSTLRPDVYPNARKLGLNAIWCAYWHASKTCPEDEGTDLFTVLKQLEQSSCETIEVVRQA